MVRTQKYGLVPVFKKNRRGLSYGIKKCGYSNVLILFSILLTLVMLTCRPIVYVSVTGMMCWNFEHYDGSIRADIWVFILSVLCRSNVLLSPPDPNFINLLTHYLAKLGELH